MSNTVEQAGILALSSLCINDSKGRIKHMFSDNDKGVGYDGKIELYRNEIHSSCNFECHVNVQVKTLSYSQSKFEKQKTIGTIKFGKLESASLDVYRKQGGVLYFHVIVSKKKKTDAIIYYKYLLPMDIIELQQKSQKTYTIELKKVTDTDLYDVCFGYFTNFKKQSQVSDKAYYWNTELPTNETATFMISSRNIESLSKSNMKLTAEDTYVYEKYNGFYRPLPFKSLEIICLENEKTDFNFSYENQNYTMNKAVKSLLNDESEWILDDTVFLRVSVVKKLVESMHIKFIDFLNNSLNEKERILAFLSIASEGINYEDENSSDFIPRAREVLDLEREIQKRFGIDPDVKFIHEETSFNKQFQLLHRIIYNPSLVIGEDEEVFSKLVEFNYGQYTFLGIFDSRRNYVSDVFSDKYKKAKLCIHPDGLNKSQEKGIQTFLYLKLALNDSSPIVPYHNFTSSIVIQSFEYHHDKINLAESMHLNAFVLYCLKVYDETKSTKYLEVAVHIATKLHESHPDESIFLLNKAQSDVRMGILTDGTAEKIMSLKEVSSGDNLIMLACSIILGDTYSTQFYKNKIPQDEFFDLLKFPIGALYARFKLPGL